METNTEYDGSLFDFFYAHVINHPNAPYLLYDTRILTYQEAYDLVAQIAQMILNKATWQVECIAINFKDQKKLLLSFWACCLLQVDIVLVPEFDLNTKDLVDSNENLRIDMMLSDFIEAVDSFDVDLTQIETLTFRFFESKSGYKNIYFFTSGTTGHPKFIITSYHQLIRAVNCIRDNHLMPYIYNQTVFITLPLFHSYGLSAMVEYTAGRSCLFLPKLKDHISPIQTLLDKNVQQQITAIEGVPYFYKQVVLMLERIQLPLLKHVGMGGDKVSEDLLNLLGKKLGKLSFSIRYGVTEIPSIVGLNYFHTGDCFLLNGLGYTLPIYKINLLSEGTEAALNRGELLIECFLYPNRAILVNTNDIVVFKDNHYHFQARRIIIKHQGFRINPVDIEDCLNQHPYISDSRVFLRDEKLTAEIVSIKADLALKEIKNHLLKLLKSYVIPDHYIFVEQVKRTRTGKIIRK